jgi:hypothetical protein
VTHSYLLEIYSFYRKCQFLCKNLYKNRNKKTARMSRRFILFEQILLLESMTHCVPLFLATGRVCVGSGALGAGAAALGGA